MTASEHDSADRSSAAQDQPNRRSFLEICGAASVAALASATPEASAAGPVARCLAPEFLQPHEVTDRKKWEWPLMQPQRVRDANGKIVPAPGPKAGEAARNDWDGKHPMQVMTPKGWIHVEDIKKGLVAKLYREPKAGTDTIDLKPPLKRPTDFGTTGDPPQPEPVQEIGGTPRDRRELRIAPEFWHREGAFDPSDFWDQHQFIPFYEVVLGAFDAEIVPGFQTKVWGYNRQVPGPTFVEHVNRPLVVRFHNELIAETSVHLHGGHTPSHSDGHPAFLIPPDGGMRDYFYPNGVPKVPQGNPLEKQTAWDWSEAASTMWYHDHANDITAHNALMGLAGFFLVTDPWEDFLIKHHILPRPNYDDARESRDIPIVLGDRCLCRPSPQTPKEARIHFDPFDHNGYLGNVAICNGRAFAKLDVKAHKYRLRFLNGALARVFLLQLWDAGDQSDLEGPQFDRFFTEANLQPQSTPQPWERIGKDSWMLEKPVHDDALLLGMANRADVVVDFKKLLKGRKRATFFLVNLCDQRNGRGPGHGDNDLARQAGQGQGNQNDAQNANDAANAKDAEDEKEAKPSPRGDRENVPRLNDPKRQAAYPDEDGGANLSTFKLLRIDVIDDGSPDPCEFDFELKNLGALLAKPEIKAEISQDVRLSQQQGVHLRKHDNLLNELTWENIAKLPRRRFDFERGRGAWRISHRFFSEERTDAPMVLGSLEVWHLVNRSGGWWHPIHIHLESHQQIQVKFDGTLRRLRPTDPKMLASLPADAPEDLQPHDRYKHDTALLGPNTEIIILMRFRTFLGPFVFHCHNLNHEDMRMMTAFDPRLESLGSDPVDPKKPPQKREVIPAPLKPKTIVDDQIENRYLPVPAPTNVQQMFGDEV